MADDAASFNTEMDSIDDTSTWSNDITTPSTNTNGLELLSVPMPRTRTAPPSTPGCPVLCVTVTPGTIPCSAMELCPTCRFAISSPDMEATDPLRLPVLVVANPTTTTSSRLATPAVLVI